MKKLLVEILVLSVSCLSCTFHPHAGAAGETETIDVVKAFEGNKTFTSEDLIKSIECVALQTNDSVLIGKNPRFFLTDAYILAVADKQLFLFDRTSGTFVRQIGRFGAGPKEYRRTDNMCPLQNATQTVSTFVDKGKRLYSLDGNVVEDCGLPPMIYETAPLSASIYAGFVPNFSGKEENRLILFDKKGTVLKTFPNPFATQAPEGIHFWKPNGWLYTYKKDLFFYELFNDTLFQVTCDTLLPRYQLAQGAYLPPYEQQNANSFVADNYFMMKNISESSRFLFYTFAFQKNTYLLAYDKKMRRSLVNRYEEQTGGVIPVTDFLPFSFSSVSENDELVGFWEAYDLAQWVSANEDKGADLPAAFRKLKGIREMDNPVVVIAKLK